MCQSLFRTPKPPTLSLPSDNYAHYLLAWFLLCWVVRLIERSCQVNRTGLSSTLPGIYFCRKDMGKADKSSYHPMSASEDEQQVNEVDLTETPSKKSRKKIKVGIPLYSTDDISDLYISEKSEFPTDLKLRHPLFGSDFEARCNLLNDATLSSQDNSPRKTKKIKLEPSDIDVIDIEDEDSSSKDHHKKKLKRKRDKYDIEGLPKKRNHNDS
ncbi:uncharacterized protein LOC132204017 isoform X3 [Neocloeon triangulifer]|uniref:uncharacterized protein LOC132204017 isoform X3 n=1 Tax=Neocloeon triangulifer TaxID=2078957 RepID=UPI00286F8549|nr:uncharacterized protein LOC132204017 isoform X3 [Neocloeon triangulifer]